MLRGLRQRFPKLHLKAFTAIEINHFTKIARLSTREVLIALREAGLGSMPGGGAEVFDDRVHDESSRANCVPTAGWRFIAPPTNWASAPTPPSSTATSKPAKNASSTCWPSANSRTKPTGISNIIPLSFIPEGSELGHLPGNTGLEDLKMLAISRLMLDNFDHVKAFWIMQSMKLSQVSLSFGVDDLDGTVVWYDITKREAGTGNRHQEQTVDSIRASIVEAGFVPVERDTLYRPVIRESGPIGRPDGAWSLDDSSIPAAGHSSCARQGSTCSGPRVHVKGYPDQRDHGPAQNHQKAGGHWIGTHDKLQIRRREHLQPP